MSLQKYVPSKTGIEIYESNSVYKDLANLMENQEFRSFFDKYSQPNITWKTMNMMMHLYREIEHRDTKLTKYEKVEIMKKLMDDSFYRQKIVNEFQKLEK